ncbi:MAG TPA: universal stress protein [Pseudonocardia sp.]|nr:universal stress protein [Pseudonocardia sp.]
MTSTGPDPRPVVVGVDASDSARDAAEWAADLAAARRCPLHLVHVVPGYEDDPAPTPPEWLREVAAAAVRSGADATDTEVVSGAAERLLLDRAVGAAMLVVGSYGEAASSGMLAGHVGLALVSHAPCPVAVIRGSAPQLPPPRSGPVVVGTDGSAAGVRTLDLGAEVALAAGAEVLAVHAFTDVSEAGGALRRRHEGWGAIVADARAELDRVAAAAQERHPDVRIRCSVEEGTALRVLLDHAETARALVVGQRDQQAPAGEMLLGSTSRGLVEFAPCPVVVCPASAGRGATTAASRAGAQG